MLDLPVESRTHEVCLAELEQLKNGYHREVHLTISVTYIAPELRNTQEEEEVPATVCGRASCTLPCYCSAKFFAA